jgi:PleD family two-component response regulator
MSVVRKAAAAMALEGVDGNIATLTVSIGVTGGPGLSVAKRLSAADRAVYRTKTDGRDRVQIEA